MDQQPDSTRTSDRRAARVRKRLIPILGPMRPMQGLLENSPMLAELLLVGDAAVDAGLILPGTAFAVYGRR